MPQKTEAGIGDVGLAYRPRKLYSDKYMNGKVVVVGGGLSFHGAPVLASTAVNNTLAAMRVGAGYAITCVPKGIEHAVRSASPELVVRALSGDYLDQKDLETLKSVAKRASAIVIGPGLGRFRETLDTVKEFVSYASGKDKRVIVDADALYAVAGMKLNRNVLITPNRFEMRLFYKYKLIDTDTPSRSKAARLVAKKMDANVLLKGHKSIITDGIRLRSVTAKSAALATMGTGDALSGIIAGFAARENDLFACAVAGAYVHTAIGDRLFKKMGNHIIATDVVSAIPEVLKRFDKAR